MTQLKSNLTISRCGTFEPLFGSICGTRQIELSVDYWLSQSIQHFTHNVLNAIQYAGALDEYALRACGVFKRVTNEELSSIDEIKRKHLKVPAGMRLSAPVIRRRRSTRSINSR